MGMMSVFPDLLGNVYCDGLTVIRCASQSCQWYFYNAPLGTGDAFTHNLPMITPHGFLTGAAS